MSAIVEPRAKHARLDASQDDLSAAGSSHSKVHVKWPDHLIPADVEVSFGWEQDPHPSTNTNADDRILLSPAGSRSGSDTSRDQEEDDSVQDFSDSILRGTSPSSATSTQIALLIRSHSQGWARSFELQRNWPMPTITSPDEVLIKNVSMGLNPVDFKSLLYKFGIERFPWVLGRDIYGVVEQVGENVKNLEVGQRVWTCSDSRDVRSGAYQAYSVHKSFTVGRLPEPQEIVSDQEAATIGTGLVTAGVALYWFFNLPKPKAISESRDERFPKQSQQASQSQEAISPLPSSSTTPWILIYGGGAVTGIYASQLAKLSGVRVISITSPENFTYLKSIGVDECIDRYKSQDQILSDIQQVIRGQDSTSSLTYALDCVGSSTATLCQTALERLCSNDQQPQLICLAGNPKRKRSERDQQSRDQEGIQEEEKEDVSRVQIHRISFSTTFYHSQSFTTSFLDSIYTLLAKKLLHPVRPIKISNGLAGIRTGLEMLRDGGEKMPRAKKLVVDLKETPNLEMTNLGKVEELGWNGCI
ncbi:unnamed protein product [Sympodiomycopsis kandeliae]